MILGAGPFDVGCDEMAWINLTIRDAETGELLDTTVEKIAKEEGKYSEDSRLYLPILVIPGEGAVFKKVEDFVRSSKEGDRTILELDPEETFGKHDSKKIKVFSVKRLERDGIRDIKKGDYVKINGEIGKVISVDGGRVRIDFNHPMAGRKLKVEVEILNKPRTREDLIRSLVISRFEISLDSEVDVEVLGGSVRIKIPPVAYTKRDAFSRKLRVISDLMKKMKDIKNVLFIEEYEIPEGP